MLLSRDFLWQSSFKLQRKIQQLDHIERWHDKASQIVERLVLQLEQNIICGGVLRACAKGSLNAWCNLLRTEIKQTVVSIPGYVRQQLR